MAPNHPAGNVRDVTVEDTEAILDLITLVDIAELGEPDHTADAIRPPIGEGFRGWVAADGDDVVGYGWIRRRADRRSIEADVTVRPGRSEHYLPLLDLVRPAARELDEELPLQIGALAQMGAKRRVLEAAGGRVVRRFLRMVAQLPAESAPRAPEPPPGVEIRPLTADVADLRTVYGVLDAAFVDHFNYAPTAFDDWLARLDDQRLIDRSLCWLAHVDGTPAAGLLATMTPSGGRVDALGTLPEFRGAGLGRALMLSSFADLYARGARKVVIGVDADNQTGAVELCQALGMSSVNEVVRYELS